MRPQQKAVKQLCHRKSLSRTLASYHHRLRIGGFIIPAREEVSGDANSDCRRAMRSAAHRDDGTVVDDLLQQADGRLLVRLRGIHLQVDHHRARADPQLPRCPAGTAVASPAARGMMLSGS